MNKKKKEIIFAVATGLAFGVGLGIAFQNILLGVAFGLIFGSTVFVTKKKEVGEE